MVKGKDEEVKNWNLESIVDEISSSINSSKPVKKKAQKKEDQKKKLVTEIESK